MGQIPTRPECLLDLSCTQELPEAPSPAILQQIPVPWAHASAGPSLRRAYRRLQRGRPGAGAAAGAPRGRPAPLPLAGRCEPARPHGRPRQPAPAAPAEPKGKLKGTFPSVESDSTTELLSAHLLIDSVMEALCEVGRFAARGHSRIIPAPAGPRRIV